MLLLFKTKSNIINLIHYTPCITFLRSSIEIKLSGDCVFSRIALRRRCSVTASMSKLPSPINGKPNTLKKQKKTTRVQKLYK